MNTEKQSNQRSLVSSLLWALSLFCFQLIIASAASIISVANDAVSLINELRELRSDDSKSERQVAVSPMRTGQLSQPQQSSWAAYNPSTGRIESFSPNGSARSWNTNFGYDDGPVNQGQSTSSQASPTFKSQVEEAKGTTSDNVNESLNSRIARAAPYVHATIEPIRPTATIQPIVPTAMIATAPVATAVQANWDSGWGSSKWGSGWSGSEWDPGWGSTK